MERLTKSNVSIDSTASVYMGKEIKIQGMSDCLLDLILNGPTLNGVNKDVLRQIIRQLYDGLKHYEDMEEQGRLVVLPCKVGDTLFMIKDGEIYGGAVRFMRWEHHRDRGIRSDIATNPTPYFSIGASFDDFGKTVFLTREEAEKALKGGAE